MKGFGAYAGLGLDVPMTKFGTTSATGHPTANNTGTCSDSFAVQQMLTDLGFPTGGVDGQIGNNTFKALASFATSTGTPYTPGDFPRAPMCQALMDAWTAAKQPALAPAAPAVPASRLFINPAIIAAFAANKRGASLPAAPAPSGGASGGAGWWGSLSGTAKIGIVGGGALVLGLIVLAATRKKKAAANRRRRARRNRRDPSRPSHAGRGGYTYFVLLPAVLEFDAYEARRLDMKPKRRIDSGWEFRSDAKDAAREIGSKGVYSRRGLERMGIDPKDPRNWR